MLERLTSALAGGHLFAWFVGFLECLDREEPDLLRVLTYHRVESSSAIPSPYLALTIPPDVFAKQMHYVSEHYHVVSAEELIHTVRARCGLPPRSILITFDDGYRDFQNRAWPVLKALQLPVVLFVPTAFPGQPARTFWWDQLHHAVVNTKQREPLETPLGHLPFATRRQRDDALRSLRTYMKRLPHSEALAQVEVICHDLEVLPPPPAVLGWDELRELKNAGVAIASHTRTHPLLTRIPPEEIRSEAVGSRHDLERELGYFHPLLAYPAGAFNDDVVRVLAEEGYLLAFTTVRGINDLRRAHLLKLRRIHVGRRTSLAFLRAQLMGRSVALNRLYALATPAQEGDT